MKRKNVKRTQYSFSACVTRIEERCIDPWRSVPVHVAIIIPHSGRHFCKPGDVVDVVLKRVQP